MTARTAESNRAAAAMGPGAGGPDHDEKRIALAPAEMRRFAQALAPFLAEELALVLPTSGKTPSADVSRRRGKEMRKWRREQRAEGPSDPIELEDQDGESSWSKNQAAELLGILKQRKRQSKSSDH